MKTATIPSLRVKPELRKAAEDVLREGETLSAFVEQSIRDNVAHRQMQAEFIARGLASREQAKRDNEYYSPDQILQELNSIMDDAVK